MFNFLHLELSSRCNKTCHMCGRRKMERDHPELCQWGDMDLKTAQKIAKQVPRATLVQFHNNGDPLCYPYLGSALWVFRHCIRQFNTNGKLLMERAMWIVGNLEVLTVSVIPQDPEGDAQYEIVRKFLDRKGSAAPRMVYRLLGDVEKAGRWHDLPGMVVTRVLHSPEGSREYGKPVTLPETGICQEILTHLAIDRYGNISLCVRFDPKGELRLGNVNEISLQEAWNGEKRRRYLEHHIAGRRDLCPGCDKCDFWGIPRGQ